MATQRPQSVSTPLTDPLSEGTGAAAVPAWLAPSSERLGARLFSSGMFLALLTTLAMTWVSFSVPGCWSELKVREPRGVEVIGDREVPATGVIREGCDYVADDCLRVDPIDGRFEVNGTAAVAGLLAVVLAGVGLVFVNGVVSFRLRAAVALCGALLMAVIAASPEAMLGMSWEGTPARPDLVTGLGPVIGAGVFVAVLFVNLVAELWGGLRGKRIALIFLADIGFGVVCGVVALLAMGGPAILVLIPVFPPLAVFAGGLRGRADANGEIAATETAPAGGRSRVRSVAFGVFAVFTTLVTAGIALILSLTVVIGMAAGGDRIDTTDSPGMVTPTAVVPTPTWIAPTPTALRGTPVTATATTTKTATPTATATRTPAATPFPTGLARGGTALVANLGGSDLRVRSGPGTNFPQIASLRDGDYVTLLSDRQVDAAGAYAWWEVRLVDGTVGWAAEGPADGSQRWLVTPGTTPTPTRVVKTPKPAPPTATRTPTRTATPTPTRTAAATPTRTPIAGPFRLEGRASTPDGAGVVGIDVAILKGGFRVDATTGEDGSFAALVPEAGIYRVTGVGVKCARNNWFSGGGCDGYNLLVEVDADVSVSLPSDTPVVLRYMRATVVVEGKILGGAARNVRAVGSDGAIGWSGDISSDGHFRIGLTPGTWRIFARNFNPSAVDGPATTVSVGADGSYPQFTIAAPP